MKQLGVAMMMYAQDYDDNYPFYRPHPAGNRGGEGFRTSSVWVSQLLPYVKSPYVFRCPHDVNPERNHTSVLVPGSATPFPVSYGPNLLFVTPAEGRPKRPISLASVINPEEKYLLADCAAACGFDLDSIARIRYPNYDPSLRQHGWSPEQFQAVGRVAWPDREVEDLTRHAQGNTMMFADGHVKWLRHDQIPNNDGRNGWQYKALVRAMVPWQP